MSANALKRASGKDVDTVQDYTFTWSQGRKRLDILFGWALTHSQSIKPSHDLVKLGEFYDEATRVVWLHVAGRSHMTMRQCRACHLHTAYAEKHVSVNRHVIQRRK